MGLKGGVVLGGGGACVCRMRYTWIFPYVCLLMLDPVYSIHSVRIIRPLNPVHYTIQPRFSHSTRVLREREKRERDIYIKLMPSING